MANNTSSHIINTAANLLGVGLFVITSLHIANLTEIKIIGQLTTFVAVLLTCSSICSFTSIKTARDKRERHLEAIADYFFIVALVDMLVIILLIALNF